MANPLLQPLDELERWHGISDPWGYELTHDDAYRKAILLSELPQRHYRRVLDIGCGQGFITRDLPGEEIIGIDISSNAIRFAAQHANRKTRYVRGSILELDGIVTGEFDLIVITGVVYPQYIGHALNLVYDSICKLLADDAILICVHIDAWYQARFPLLRLREHFYPYKEHTHRLEVYIK